MTCSICIATYKRPILLNKLLNSLFVQVLPKEVDLEIIVVDNDIDETAKNTCSIFSDTEKIKLYYLTQTVQNISLTRNKAVERATGEYILFVDDDEYACDTWILELLECIKKYNADAVFGAVIPYFEQGIPDWIKDGHFFDKGLARTGNLPEIVYTSNCIVKANLIKPLDEPFNPALGLSGGEDGMLFGTLERNGAKFVFSAEAIVYDFIPLERGTLNYLTQKAFRVGITYTRAGIIFSRYKFVEKIYSLFKGILYTVISLSFFLFFSPVKLWRNHWYIKFWSNLGHIVGVFNYKYKMYQD